MKAMRMHGYGDVSVLSYDEIPTPAPGAAALPIAGLTAWQAVHEHAAVTAGQRVLVTGIGAVGRLAVQLARNAGAHVTAVAGPRSRDAARETRRRAGPRPHRP